MRPDAKSQSYCSEKFLRLEKIYYIWLLLKKLEADHKISN